MTVWYVYIVRCKNDSLYTGITTDVAARVTAHNAGKGAKYTRAFGPVELVYSKKMKSGTAARKLEAAVKSLTRQQKEKLL